MTEYEKKYGLLYNFAQHVSHVYELPESLSEWMQTFTAFVELSPKMYHEDITGTEAVQLFISLNEQFFPEPVRFLTTVLKGLGSGLMSRQFFDSLATIHAQLLNLLQDFVTDFMKWEQEYREAERLTPQIVSYRIQGLQLSEEEIDDCIHRGILNPDFPNCLKLFKRYLWGLELMTRLGFLNYLALWILDDESALQQPFVINSIKEIRHRAMRGDKKAQKLKRLLMSIIFHEKLGGRPRDTEIYKRIDALHQQGMSVDDAVEKAREEMGEERSFGTLRRGYFRYKKVK